MKRTREVLHYTHPDNRQGISGCNTFDGEDLTEEERKKQMQKQQREWLMQQMEEKKQKQQFEQLQDKLHDQQRLHFTNLQNQQTAEQQQRMREMTKATKETNMTLHSYKMDQERKQKEDSHEQDRQELAMTNATELKFRATQSYADRFRQ